MENYTREPLTAEARRTALRHCESYKISTDYSLRDAYGRYSRAKEEAWDYCKELMHKFDGYGLKVIGHNCHTFSAGFMFEWDNITMFMYITPTRDIAVEVEE